MLRQLKARIKNLFSHLFAFTTRTHLYENDDRSQAVLWGFRLLLDREPESSIVIEKAKNVSSYSDLRKEFLQSDEYQKKNPAAPVSALSGNESRLKIEVGYSEADLQLLFDHIQNTWEQFGETEPFWSVLSADKFRMANIEKAKDEFYQSGQGDALRFINTLKRNGIEQSRLKSCLEYGCGMGRVTSWLAQYFEQVVGYDISQSHVKLATQYITELKLRNVTFHQAKTMRDVTNLPKTDAIYSIIVLQHNPPPVIHFIIDGFLKALNSGGVAYFQVPTYRYNYRFSIKEYLQGQAQRNEMEMHVLPQSEIFKLVHANECKVVEVIEDNLAGTGQNALSNTFLIQKS